MVRKSVMFINVIVDIAFSRRWFVFSQSSCEVSASPLINEAWQSEQLILYTVTPRFKPFTVLNSFAFEKQQDLYDKNVNLSLTRV